MNHPWDSQTWWTALEAMSEYYPRELEAMLKNGHAPLRKHLESVNNRFLEVATEVRKNNPNASESEIQMLLEGPMQDILINPRQTHQKLTPLGRKLLMEFGDAHQ